ncbi:hypothetical protein [Candidatus Protochlamydia sp. W-9]|uniref:hypothetical protein n=1 Tax=Candidatus Protochlamydia sp. W-9 TaxID=1785087 RepID=UPI00096AAA38|nr:hypothetical protein [Candidatus Protochlamydia sp. W-9]
MSEEAEKLIQVNAKEIDSHDEQMAKHRNKKKIKATIYLTEEAEQAFTELYIHRLRKDRKINRSSIACDAIMDLYEKECCKPN